MCSFYVSVCPCLSLPVSVCLCLSLSLCVSLSLSIPICLSVSLSPLSLPLSTSHSLPLSLLLCLCVCVCLSPSFSPDEKSPNNYNGANHFIDIFSSISRQYTAHPLPLFCPHLVCIICLLFNPARTFYVVGIHEIKCILKKNNEFHVLVFLI